MDPKRLLEEYLKGNKLLQLATVSDEQPWVCNVYFVHDKDYTIYWTSAKSRRHSKEIKMHTKAAATIVHDEDKKQAVQIAGLAAEVPLDDVERVNELYAAKFGDKPERLQEVLENMPGGRAYWVLMPEIIELWDEVNFPDSPKQPVSLE